MMFTLGDLLVLSVVVLVIFIFRHLDRNNRSLDKVKRFTDRIQGELAAIAEEKSQQLRDISIGVDVHQQSARRAIEQLEASAEELNAKSAYIEEIQQRIGQYDLALKQLVEMTGRAEANIKGIQKESAYVDTVGRRIKDAQKRMESIEAQIPALVERFSDDNRGLLEKASQSVLKRSEAIARDVNEKVTASRGEINEVLATLEDRKSVLLEQLDGAFETRSAELASAEQEFRQRMNEVAGKARNFELQAFEEMKTELDSLRDQRFAEYRSLLEGGFSELERELEDSSREYRQKLVDQNDEIDTRIYRLEQDLENRINESGEAGRGIADEVLERISADMQSRGQALEQTIAGQLADLDERVRLSHSRIDTGFTDLKTRLDEWMDKSNTYIEELDSQFSRLSEKSVLIEQEHADRIRSVEEEIARTEADVNRRFDSLKAESARLVAEAAELVNREIDEAGQANRQHLQNRFAELDGMIRETQDSAYQQAEKIREQIDRWDEDFTARLQDVVSGGQERIAEIDQRFAGETARLLQNVGEQKDAVAADFDEIMARHRKQLDDQLEASGADIQRIQGLNEENRRRISEIDVSLQNSIDELGTALQEGHRGVREKIDGDSLALEQKILGELEKRLSDYEGNINYRLSRLEGVGDELEQLDEEIHQSMSLMNDRVQEDMRALSERMHRQWTEDLNLAREELGELTAEMQAHQDELRRMKDQSHQSMAEQLQVLEQGFFKDLTERGQSLDERLESWSEDFNNTLDRIRKDSEDERLALEKKYIDDFSTRLESLRSGIGIRIEEMQSEFRDREGIIREDLSVLAEKIAGARSGVDQQLEELKAQSQTLIESRYQDIRDLLGSRFGDVQREVDIRAKQLGSELEEHSSELRGLHEAVRSDVTLWQNQVLQRIKNSEGGVEEELSSFRIKVNETLTALREEFDGEKDAIIADGQAARERLQSGIQEASVQLNELNSALETRSEEALSRFNLDFQSFMQEFGTRKNDFGREIDESVREFRGFVSETREEFEGTQKRLIERLNDDIKTLELTIREIDKKQKGFLQQTKLFERADNLKRSLTEDIVHLKAEIDRLQGERKQVGEMQGDFVRIRKMAEDANEKMARFIGEQRRLEGIEDNYKKLISLSQTVDGQLDKVTAKHDSLQQMQLAIRNLDDLQKELDQRYERLTKRKEIIDTTLEGVDRNFHSLTDLENRITEMGRGVGELGDTIETIKSRLDSLALNKKESDMAMRNLQSLNQMMGELEERMEGMQKAREWLARTETRLEEVAQQADHKVEMLGSIASGKILTAEEGKPAPSVSVRDMVIKLKHQGWKIEDIAKSCKISRGEVELILEMAHR
jgi:DNA repair exonuclease SbcCD ATPase subunit